METRNESAKSPEKINRKAQPFLAVNIRPTYTDSNVIDPAEIYIFAAKINLAQELGFTHIWLNPICKLDPKEKVIKKTDLDTGAKACLYQSSYSIPNPTEIRTFFKDSRVLKIIADAKKKNISVLVDFAWLYGGLPGFAAKSKDSDETKKESLIKAKKAIDLYLGELGFSGLRIDAASHLDPDVRVELYEYIQKKHPHAIIMEEVLFDRAAEANVEKMVRLAHKNQTYSTYVTSNLYYAKTDAFGALPSQEAMGDSLKLQLAQNRGIGFTGNHDHFSLGWGVILAMAAKKAVENKDFLAKISKLRAFPINCESGDDGVSAVIETLTALANREISIEEAGNKGEWCLKYLFPFATEISRKLLEKDKKTLNEYKNLVKENLINRTMAAPSGYFCLESELTSPFYTQRIFTNKKGADLELFLLTADDLLKNEAALQRVYEKMRAEIIAENVEISVPEKNEEKENSKDKKTKSNKMEVKSGKQSQSSKSKTSSKSSKVSIDVDNNSKSSKKSSSAKVYKEFDNISNFDKIIPLFHDKKDTDKKSKKNRLRIWLPYIVSYLRNHPAEAADFDVYKDPNKNIHDKAKQLHKEVGVNKLFKNINQIYAKLQTIGTGDYQTFTSDNLKIIVRCTEQATDITVINLNPAKKVILNDNDMKKIATWYQARLFSEKDAGISGKHLSGHLDGKKPNYFPAQYSGYWEHSDNRKAFADSFQRIVGDKRKHETNLYVSDGIDVKLKELAGKINCRVGGNIDKTKPTYSFSNVEVVKDSEEKPKISIRKSQSHEIRNDGKKEETKVNGNPFLLFASNVKKAAAKTPSPTAKKKI